MPEGQIAETETADSDPDKFLHLVTDFVKHSANLAVDSLSENDAEMSGFDRTQNIDSRSLTVEHDPFQKFWCERGVPRPIERYLVFLLDLVARMGEPLGEVAVVGEKKKTFGLGIQPPDVEQPRQMRREQIENRIARVRILSGRNESGRLMQHDVETLFPVDHFAVDLDVVAVAWLNAKIGADAAVNRDATGGNELVAMPARTKPGRGEEPVQAHFRNVTA